MNSYLLQYDFQTIYYENDGYDSPHLPVIYHSLFQVENSSTQNLTLIVVGKMEPNKIMRILKLRTGDWFNELKL